MKLVVVESPHKAETIAGFLGDEFKVMASYGHIRDLPREGLAIDLESGRYEIQYEFIPGRPIPGAPDRMAPGGAARVDRLRKVAREAEVVYLATDPDREGEAIAAHLKDALRLTDDQYRRVVFPAISERVVQAEIRSPRRIDQDLVSAQEARRALDRLVGYLVSPMLSERLGLGVSAGRVQSPALRLVVEREREIKAFKETRHFGAAVSFEKGAWSAEWDTRPHLPEGIDYILDAGLAERAAACRAFRVTESETTTAREAPPSPFSTSLLLNAAGVTLKWKPEQTQRVAQQLFDAGHITYHRTDSVNFDEEGTEAVRTFALAQGWKVPDTPRKWKAKGAAQEGHPAIQPTNLDEKSAGADPAQRALYELIWNRSVASQLCDAVYSVSTVGLVAQSDGTTFEFRAKGRVLVERGWRQITAKDSAEDEEDEGDTPSGGQVPSLPAGSEIRAEDGKVLNKRTKPPLRYAKHSLVTKMEAMGIGRPSTFAAITQNITARGYVVEQKFGKKEYLVPSEVGCDLIDALMQGSMAFIDFGFSRDLESELDQIARGKASYVQVVGNGHTRLREDMERLTSGGAFAPRYPCPECGKGLRRLKSGDSHFWGCSGYQDGCKVAMDDDNGKPVARVTHECPACGQPMRRFKGSLGPFWSCSDREKCGKTMDDDNGRPTERQVHSCPQCGKPLRRIKGAKGVFWGCTGYQEGCEVAMDDKGGKPAPRLLHNCPTCGKPLRRIKGTNGFFWGCTGYQDGCKTTLPDEKGKPGKAGKPKASK